MVVQSVQLMDIKRQRQNSAKINEIRLACLYNKKSKTFYTDSKRLEILSGVRKTVMI